MCSINCVFYCAVLFQHSMSLSISKFSRLPAVGGAAGRCWQHTATVDHQQREHNANKDHNVSGAYSSLKLGDFAQDRPQLQNPYRADATLQRFLHRNIQDEAVFSEIDADLDRFGERIVSEIDVLGRECELNPPTLDQYDAWGHRIDAIRTCEAWSRQKAISATEGLVALGYTRRSDMGAAARLYQYAKLCMYAPSSGLYSCPLAMTDGAAKVFQELNMDVDGAYDRLTSVDPDRFWTSGQWMTERRGGSDVAAGTDTRAVQSLDGTYRLYGHKWFSSATDADMTLTLARECDDNGQLIQGTRGLSLFYVRVHDSESTNQLNGIQIVRLKDKLGTRQLSPTGRGVRGVAHMLNITRLHNSIAAVGAMRKILNLSRDYAQRRVAFGRRLVDWPLHMRTLAEMETYARACSLLTLRCVQLLGSSETNEATTGQQAVLRLMTPIAKLFTAKAAMSVISEGLESFGGLGYMEDSGLPSGFRDAQVLPIWEGTTNVLSLDVCRVLFKDPGVLEALHTDVSQLIQNATDAKLQPAIGAMKSALDAIGNVPLSLLPDGAARDYSFTLGNVYAGALLLDQASQKDSTASEQLAALSWCTPERLNAIKPLSVYEDSSVYSNLVME